MSTTVAWHPALANAPSPLCFLQDLQRGGAANSSTEQGLPRRRLHTRHRKAGQSQRGGRRSTGRRRGHSQSPAGGPPAGLLTGPQLPGKYDWAVFSGLQATVRKGDTDMSFTGQCMAVCPRVLREMNITPGQCPSLCRIIHAHIPHAPQSCTLPYFWPVLCVPASTYSHS